MSDGLKVLILSPSLSSDTHRHGLILNAPYDEDAHNWLKAPTYFNVGVKTCTVCIDALWDRSGIMFWLVKNEGMKNSLWSIA